MAIIIKHCPGCNRDLLISEYAKHAGNSTGYQARCRTCTSAAARALRKAGKVAPRKLCDPSVVERIWADRGGVKACCRCKVVQPRAAFRKHAKQKDGHNPVCRTCRNAGDRSSRRAQGRLSWAEYQAKVMSAAATVERLNRAWDVLAVRNAHEAWSWWLENAPDWWKRARETHRREMQLGWWLASTHKKRAAELGVPSDVDGRALTSLMTKATHCHWCGDPLTRDIYGGGVNRWTDATYDHVVPLCEGGANTISNIVIAHAGCNYARDERAGRFVAKYGTVCA